MPLLFIITGSNGAGNLEKLNQHYKVLDTLDIIDTSESNHVLLAQLKNDKMVYCLGLDQLPNGLSNISLI